MMTGWFSVHFMHEDYCKKIMESGGSFMLLILWFLGFNQVIDASKRKLVSVKLPSLPLEFWTLKALRANRELNWTN